jgi:hypothetical protein
MKTVFRLSKEVFEAVVSRSRMKGAALNAARDVLINGVVPSHAALLHDISKQRVGFAVKRIRNNALKLGACPCCGQAIKQEVLDEVIKP